MHRTHILPEIVGAVRLRRRIQLLFGALFLILVAGVATDTLADMARADAADTIDDHLVPARDDLHALLTSLVEQETGQRGFLLTGEQSFLLPYTNGKRQTELLLERLRTRFEGDVKLSDGLDRIRSRISAWQQLGADFEIDAKRRDRDAVVTALVSSGTATHLFEQARAEIDDEATAVAGRQNAKEHHVHHLDQFLVLLRIGN